LPLYGKAPAIEAWQKQNDTTEHEIEFWSRMHPAAQNTGILTRLTPTLDVDIRDPYAAAAVERLARDRFEDKGRILVRFGNTPKRCIPFQTIEPFPKILRLLGDADTPVKECEKLEFLCDGQQVVVDGVHPDTGKPYSWFGGAPGQIKQDDLPQISAGEAQALVDDAARLLVEEFGYRCKTPKPQGNGAGGGDWSFTPDDLIDHGRLTTLAMRLLKSGMGAGAAVNFLRTAVAGVANVDDERRQRRLKEIPGLVSSAQARLGLPPPPGLDPPAPPSNQPRLTLGDFWAYMLQHNYIFAPTGELWPGASVNSRIPPISVGTNENGEPIKIPASVWLDQRKPVEQMTWSPASRR
jgi:hypothetical protein